MATNKKQKPPKRPASHQRQIAANKARDKKSKEIGGIQGKFLTRAEPKKPGESEFQYIARGFIESFEGANDIKKAGLKAVKKVVKKLNG